MLGALCRLVDGRTECKMAGGSAWRPIKDVMGCEPRPFRKVAAWKRRAGIGYPRGHPRVEVENDLGFSGHFQQPGEKQVDPGEVCALLAALLAHGCNLGLYTMEKVAPDIAYRRLKYVSDWRLVEENPARRARGHADLVLLDGRLFGSGKRLKEGARGARHDDQLSLPPPERTGRGSGRRECVPPGSAL